MTDKAKKLLIDAIVGKGFFSDHYADLMEEKGLAEFTGDQHNPEWEWIPWELRKLPTDELEKIYEATEKDFPAPPCDGKYTDLREREETLRDMINRQCEEEASKEGDLAFVRACEKVVKETT